MTMTQSLSDSGESQRFDSTTLMSVFANMQRGQYRGSMGPMSNSLTGLNTERDPTNYAAVNQFVYTLNHQERESLFRNSRICKNLVLTYPLEGRWANFTFGTKRSDYGADSQTVDDYFENGLKTGSLHKKFVDASIEARLHGRSYLLLGIEDGRAFNKPVDWENINSFDWAEVRVYTQVQESEKNRDTYMVALDFDNMRANLKDNGTVIEVHKGRLLEFVGDYLPDSILESTQTHDSCLQAAFGGFSLAMNALLSTNAMMADHSLFWYKLDGLAQLIRQGKQDEIYSRFLSLQMGKSVLKGLALDAKAEEIGFVARQYGGVKEIVDLMLSFLVAETGMVRYKILGVANNAGLGAEGRGLQDRLEHAFKLNSWQMFTWKDNLMFCLKVYLCSKTGMTQGRLPKSYGFVFPPSLELTPLEMAEIQEKNVNVMNTAVTAGFLHKYEARMALFGASEPPVILAVSLDDRMNVYMEDQMNNETDQIGQPTQQTAFQTPEDPNVDPSTEADQTLNEIDTNFDADTKIGGSARTIEERRQADRLSRWEIQTRERQKPYIVYAASRNEAIRKANKAFTGGKKTIIGVRSLHDEQRGTYYKANTDEEDEEEILVPNTAYRQDILEHNKKSKKWILWNHNHTKILGEFDTEEEAKKREAQINFFKHKADDDQSPENQIDQFTRLKKRTLDQLKSISEVTPSDLKKILSVFDGVDRPSNRIGVIQSSLETVSSTLQSSVDDLFNKVISVDDFILEVGENLQTIHVMNAVQANNGKTELPENHLNIVRKNLSDQFLTGKDETTGKQFGLKFLAQDLELGQTADQLKNRVDLFSMSGKATKEEVTLDNKTAQGMTEGLRILGASEHCPECIEYGARGWVKLEDLILPTQGCSCKNKCKCRILYR